MKGQKILAFYGAISIVWGLLSSGYQYLSNELLWNLRLIDPERAIPWITELGGALGAVLVLVYGQEAVTKWWAGFRGRVRDSDPAKETHPPTPVIRPEPPATPAVEPEPEIRNYFSVAELECKGQRCNCEFPGMDPRIMQIVNQFRRENGPTIVVSAYRCPQHNSDVGGVLKSRHVKGMAMDIRCPDMTPEQVWQWFERRYPNTLGLGIYDRFVHVDCRVEKARWDERTPTIVL